jgi:hypothetical protein
VNLRDLVGAVLAGDREIDLRGGRLDDPGPRSVHVAQAPPGELCAHIDDLRSRVVGDAAKVRPGLARTDIDDLSAGFFSDGAA